MTPWTVAHQAPLSMGFSRQEYWSGLPCLSPRDLPDPGVEPMSFLSTALAGGFFTTEPPGKSYRRYENETGMSLSSHLLGNIGQIVLRATEG